MTKRYSHLSPEHLQSAVAVIDREINQTSGLLAQFSGTVDQNDPSANTTRHVTA